jgi:hypothetical protein
MPSKAQPSQEAAAGAKMLERFWEDAFLGLNAEESALLARGGRFGF